MCVYYVIIIFIVFVYMQQDAGCCTKLQIGVNIKYKLALHT